jgi:hypothetical protein
MCMVLYVIGKISLCDLAGSERPSKAEVAGLPPAEQYYSYIHLHILHNHTQS